MKEKREREKEKDQIEVEYSKEDSNICRSVVGREIVSWPIESISNLESGKCRNIPVALRMTLMFDTCSSGFAARPIICC